MQTAFFSWHCLVGEIALLVTGGGGLALAQAPGGDDTGSVGSVNEEGETPGVPDIVNMDEYPGPLGRVDERLEAPDCETCFTVPGFTGSARYQVFESVRVGDKEHIISREIPNPAPLEEGEIRPTVDDAGEPLWYIGRQGYTGPTDEEPFSEHHSLAKIDMLRIKFRHEDVIFDIPGVNGFGIGQHGFFVSISAQEALTHRHRIPQTLEGVPVEVRIEEISPLSTHSRRFRPVPAGVGIGSQWWEGTLGPHVVSRTGGCCSLWSLTAGHVVKPRLSSPSPPSGTTPIYQPGGVSLSNLFAYVLHAFALTPCQSDCGAGDFTNRTNAVPDIALLDPIPLGVSNPSPFNYPVAEDPTRHMQFDDGDSDYTNGPSGEVRVPEYGDWHKIWGSRTRAGSAEQVSGTGVTRVLGQGSDHYRICCVNLVNLWSEDGDSGALIAYSGRGKRDVAGVGIAKRVEFDNLGREEHIRGTYYVVANDITTALSGVGWNISHFWGTKGNYRSPATETCDEPDGC